MTQPNDIHSLPDKLTVIVPVWGERHVRTFLELSLPTLLSPRNLPALNSRLREIAFVTDAGSRAALEADDRIQSLAQAFSVRFLVEPSGVTFPYALMSWRINRALDTLCAREGVRQFILHLPDMLWADGSFANLGRRIDEGYDAVLVSGVRVTEEGLRQDLPSRFSDGRFSPALMLDLIAHHLHPLYRACIWRGAANGSVSSHIWETPRGLLLHNYHPWPVWFRIQHPEVRVSWDQTLDHEFLELACPGGKFHVVETPWDLGFLEASPETYDQFGTPSDPIDEAGHARWAARWTTAQHRQFALTGMFFGTERGSSPETTARQRAIATIARINALIPPGESIACHRRLVDFNQPSATFSGAYEDGWLAPRVRIQGGPARAGDRYRLTLEIREGLLPPGAQTLCDISIESGERRKVRLGGGRSELDLEVTADTSAVSIHIEFDRFFPHPDGLRRQVSAFCVWNECRVLPHGTASHGTTQPVESPSAQAGAKSTDKECDHRSEKDSSTTLRAAPGRPGLILVYQLGKAGSTSIHESLRRKLPESVLKRMHFMGPIVTDAFERILGNAPPEQVAPSFVENLLAQVAYAREVRACVSAAIAAGTPVRAICGVREPIDYCVSVFAQVVHAAALDPTRVTTADTPAVEAMRHRFIELLEKSLTLHFAPADRLDRFLVELFRLSRTWMEDDLAVSLGLSARVPGYHPPFKIVTRGCVQALFYRFEDLGAALEQGIRDFVAWSDFSMPRTNVSGDKEYGAFFRRFRAELRLPESLVRRYLASTLVADFYSEPEQAAILARWVAGATTPKDARTDERTPIPNHQPRHEVSWQTHG